MNGFFEKNLGFDYYEDLLEFLGYSKISKILLEVVIQKVS